MKRDEINRLNEDVTLAGGEHEQVRAQFLLAIMQIHFSLLEKKLFWKKIAYATLASSLQSRLRFILN